jgi:hypothetical protein
MKCYAATLVLSFYRKSLWNTACAEHYPIATVVADVLKELIGIHFSVTQCISGLAGSKEVVHGYSIYATYHEKIMLTTGMAAILRGLKASKHFEIVSADLHLSEVDAIDTTAILQS